MNWSETPVTFGDLLSFLIAWEGIKLVVKLLAQRPSGAAGKGEANG